MLNQLCANAPKSFNALANSWLNLGANAFYISAFGKEVRRWPQNDVPLRTDLSAAIVYRGLELGALHIQGLSDATLQSKLTAEAELIAKLIAQEAELEVITSELVDAQDMLLAFFDIAHSTKKLLNLDQIVQAITRAVHQISQAECSFMLLRLPHQMLHSEQIPAHYVPPETLMCVFEQMLEIRRTLINNNNDSAAPLPPQIDNLLISPIFYNEEIIGAIGLLNRPSQKFSTRDVKLIEAICQQTEVKIANAIYHEQALAQTRMKTEMALAQKVQFHLLPQRLPVLPELDIAANSLPALQVGGDFFDFIQLPNGPLIFAVGDVAGKGVSSALLMAMSRTAIRGAVKMLAQSSPEKVLDQTNEDLYDDFTEVGMFATIFMGYYTPGAEKLVYANAGHSPVIYCPQDGEPILLEADGTAVGILPINLAKNQTIPFCSGDILVVATDGFSEASNPAGELFGYDRLLQLIGNHRHLGAQALFQTLHNTITEFSDSKEQDDDQTIIILKAVRPC